MRCVASLVRPPLSAHGSAITTVFQCEARTTTTRLYAIWFDCSLVGLRCRGFIKCYVWEIGRHSVTHKLSNQLIFLFRRWNFILYDFLLVSPSSYSWSQPQPFNSIGRSSHRIFLFNFQLKKLTQICIVFVCVCVSFGYERRTRAHPANDANQLTNWKWCEPNLCVVNLILFMVWLVFDRFVSASGWRRCRPCSFGCALIKTPLDVLRVSSRSEIANCIPNSEKLMFLSSTLWTRLLRTQMGKEGNANQLNCAECRSIYVWKMDIVLEFFHWACRGIWVWNRKENWIFFLVYGFLWKWRFRFRFEINESDQTSGKSGAMKYMRLHSLAAWPAVCRSKLPIRWRSYRMHFSASLHRTMYSLSI